MKMGHEVLIYCSNGRGFCMIPEIDWSQSIRGDSLHLQFFASHPRSSAPDFGKFDLHSYPLLYKSTSRLLRPSNASVQSHASARVMGVLSRFMYY
jgi:hypothetical protein